MIGERESKQTQPAPTASTAGPFPTIIQISFKHSTESYQELSADPASPSPFSQYVLQLI